MAAVTSMAVFVIITTAALTPVGARAAGPAASPAPSETSPAASSPETRTPDLQWLTLQQAGARVARTGFTARLVVRVVPVRRLENAGRVLSQSPGRERLEPAGTPIEVTLGRGSPVPWTARVAVEAARTAVGIPYVYGGASPRAGFDCSGLAMWAWGRAGIRMPHEAAAQYSRFPHVSRWRLRPGDLLFFYGLSHVGIYVGDGLMIDAPHTGDHVRVERLASWWWPVFVGAARP